MSDTRVSYLDVDEVLAVLDDVHVGVVDRLLVVFDARRPIRGRAKDLRADRRLVKKLSRHVVRFQKVQFSPLYIRHAETTAWSISVNSVLQLASQKCIKDKRDWITSQLISSFYWFHLVRAKWSNHWNLATRTTSTSFYTSRPWILTEQLDCDWSDVNRIRKHLITSQPDTWRSNRTNLHFGRDAVWDLVALLSGRGVRLGQQTRVRHGAVLRLHELVRKQRVKSPVGAAWGIPTDKCWIWKCFSLEEFQQTLLTPC